MQCQMEWTECIKKYWHDKIIIIYSYHTKDYEVIVMIIDKAGKIFEDRRKKNIKVDNDRRNENNEKKKTNQNKG